MAHHTLAFRHLSPLVWSATTRSFFWILSFLLCSTELYRARSHTVLCPRNMNLNAPLSESLSIFPAPGRAQRSVLIQTRPPRENCSIFFAIIDTDDPAQHPTRAPCRPYAKYIGVFHNHARQTNDVSRPTVTFIFESFSAFKRTKKVYYNGTTHELSLILQQKKPFSSQTLTRTK